MEPSNPEATESKGSLQTLEDYLSNRHRPDTHSALIFFWFYLDAVFSAEFLCVKRRTVHCMISEFTGGCQQWGIFREHRSIFRFQSDGFYQHGITRVFVRLKL